MRNYMISEQNPPRLMRAGLAWLWLPWRLNDAEPFDCLTQNIDILLELIYGHEFAGAMRDADVARAEHNGVGSQRDHARRFGAKGHRARRIAGCLFEKLDQR